jgi:hypothetical protein
MQQWTSQRVLRDSIEWIQPYPSQEVSEFESICIHTADNFMFVACC